MAKVCNKIETCKDFGEKFSKNVPARNEKESKGMIQGILQEYIGHVLDKSWTHPRCLRDAFGMPIEKHRTTPKKKVDCFAKKLDFFTRKRGSQSTFCCNATKKPPKPKLQGQVSINKLSAPEALTATWCSIKRRICSRSFYIVCRMTYAVGEVVEGTI